MVPFPEKGQNSSKNGTISEEGQNSSTKMVPFQKKVKFHRQKMVPFQKRVKNPKQKWYHFRKWSKFLNKMVPFQAVKGQNSSTKLVPFQKKGQKSSTKMVQF